LDFNTPRISAVSYARSRLREASVTIYASAASSLIISAMTFKTSLTELLDQDG
jgi:hypothetical protein